MKRNGLEGVSNASADVGYLLKCYHFGNFYYFCFKIEFENHCQAYFETVLGKTSQ